jgi:hypothetical protein
MFVTVLHYGLFLPKSEEHPLTQASAVGIVRFLFYSPDQQNCKHLERGCGWDAACGRRPFVVRTRKKVYSSAMLETNTVELDTKFGFLKDICAYFRDFLDTDFKRQAAPT